MHPCDIGDLKQQLIGTLVWKMLVRNGPVSGKVCFMWLLSLNTNKARCMCQCG